MFQRFIKTKVEEALTDMPVVYLAGPRQSGKSTLAKEIARQDRNRRYISLDDMTNLMAAQRDPVNFINSIMGPCIIDEIQRCPELLLPLKMRVDDHRVPGQYLLTGSANILTLPKVSDSLAGRMEIHKLFPLSYQEILGQQNSWINQIFESSLREIFEDKTKTESTPLVDIQDFVISGGYPDAYQKLSSSRRFNWFQSYIQTLIERDVSDLMRIGEIDRIRHLISILATRSATLMNTADMARVCGIPGATATLYLSLLQTIFLTASVPAWFRNRGKQLLKTPKVFLLDSGLLCHLLSVTKLESISQSHAWGPIVETFVFTELLKQMGFRDNLMTLFHYRSYNGEEVDFVIEGSSHRIFGIEVKAAQSVSSKDFKSLRQLKVDQDDIFQGGIVLYFGRELVSFAPDLYAVPIHMIL